MIKFLEFFLIIDELILLKVIIALFLCARKLNDLLLLFFERLVFLLNKVFFFEGILFKKILLLGIFDNLFVFVLNKHSVWFKIKVKKSG